jgi:hypothetical protein
MVNLRPFWKLDRLSDSQVLEGVDSLVRSGRRLTAELIAHLAEVEERRLHLKAAYGSMFSYCVSHCGMSDDEACRRIEVARLARKFPALFDRLEKGEITLTVAAMLKPYLSAANHETLFAAVAGKTTGQAREAIAELFPRPDVASLVRKLPERREDATAVPAPAPARAPGESASTNAGEPAERRLDTSACPSFELSSPNSDDSSPVPPLTTERPEEAAASYRAEEQKPTHRPRVEPLAAGRYRVQFTAGATLKQKLEQARDLCRHRNPSGDFAPIVEEALDLLLAKLMKQRFGVTDKPKRSGEKRRTNSTRIPNAVRRKVLENDGLRCSFVDDQGRRCEARAFLELDHVKPRGKGGSSEVENVRVFCRAHNHLAAELEYGRKKIDDAIERRRARSRAPKPLVIRDIAFTRSARARASSSCVYPRWRG